METIYSNDARVDLVTRIAIDRTGSRLLQIHRFAPGDQAHTDKLLEYFDPPQKCRIADVGCGVGALAALMRHKRPDLDFILINKSPSQLHLCPAGFEKREGVAEDLPLKPGEVDAIMATYVLGHVDLPRFVAECDRVLEKEKHVYIYDLFKANVLRPCWLEHDLGYADRTAVETIAAFDDAGFRLTRQPALAAVAPTKILELMPQTVTLRNTVSAALVFKK